MKRFTLLGAFVLTSFLTPIHAETMEDLPTLDSGLFDLEKELLSLEDELMNLEAPAPVESKEKITPFFHIHTPPLEMSAEESLPESPLTDAQEISEESAIFFESQDLSLPKKEEISFVSLPTIESAIQTTAGMMISFAEVFKAAPFIYSLLLGMSFIAITVSLYFTARLRKQKALFSPFAKEIKTQILENGPQEALAYCQNNPNLLSQMVLSGFAAKDHGIGAIVENMKSEGKRASISFWQQLGILQDIVIIAPMLGLLGTVIGLFYAFYDLNRSLDSLSNLLDGLGISVGTTVAGIAVAILAMILQSTSRFRLVRTLAKLETEAVSLAYLLDNHTDQ